MMKNEIAAVIPVRKGSVRVKDKNTRPFADTTLLELKISVLKKVKGIHRIIVNTDSDLAIELAKKHNVEFHLRDAFYASSKCSANDYFEYLAKSTPTEFIAYTPVTAPFISVDTYERCIADFNFQDPEDTIVTGKLLKEFLFKGNVPLNFSLDNHPKSQDFNEISSVNFGLCLLSKRKIIETKTILGNKPRIVLVDEIEGIDIDTMLDFEFAEYVYKSNKMKFS